MLSKNCIYCFIILIEFCSTGIEIFGDNERFLRIPNPVLASTAEQTNIGEFICNVCYYEISPFPGQIFVPQICTNSTSEINVIGE